MENMEMELNVVETPVEENASVVTEVESAEDQQIVESNENIEEEKKPKPTITETPNSMIEVVYSSKKEKLNSTFSLDCCYWECCVKEYCDKCNRRCNGKINGKGHRAQTMDQSKMCLKNQKDPDVYYINKKESKDMIDGTKVAYFEIKIDPRIINKDNPNPTIKVFFGVKDEEE